MAAAAAWARYSTLYSMSQLHITAYSLLCKNLIILSVLFKKATALQYSSTSKILVQSQAKQQVKKFEAYMNEVRFSQSSPYFISKKKGPKAREWGWEEDVPQ